MMIPFLRIKNGWGVYLYVVEGGPIRVSGHSVPPLGAAKVVEEVTLQVKAEIDAELLLVHVLLI